MFVASDLDTTGQKPFATNIDVTVTPRTGSPEQGVEDASQAGPDHALNYRRTTDVPVTLSDGRTARLIGGTYDVPGTGSLRNMQLLVLDAGDSYVVTATMTATGYIRYESAVRSALLSFRRA